MGRSEGMKEKRKRFLRAAYEMSISESVPFVGLDDVAQTLGMDLDQAQQIANYWGNKGFIKSQADGYAIFSLTPYGIDEVEREDPAPRQTWGDVLYGNTNKSSDTVAERVPPTIQESLQAFKEDHPDPAEVAFILMQFGRTKAHEEITKAVKNELSEHGIVGVRADDKEYHTDLFPNVQTYLHGCGLGVAIFERIEAERFNPNVSLEVGYMFAMDKLVCLLKDQTLTALQADLVGKLYRAFDPQDPANTISSNLSQWLNNWGLSRR